MQHMVCTKEKNFDMSSKGILFIDQYKIHRDLI